MSEDAQKAWAGAFATFAITASIAAVLIAWITSDNGGMTLYERQAYENYLDVCREQGINTEPPHIHTNREDFDTIP